MKMICCLVLGLIFCSTVSAQEGLNLYEKKLFIKGADTLRYRILYPKKYKKRKSYPLIVFLHGSGERGNDNEKQLFHGGDLFVKEEVRKYFPAIVIFPQSPVNITWSNFKRTLGKNDWQFFPDQPPTIPQQLVKDLLDSFVNNKMADSKRVYIGGISLGGLGTYEMLIRYPDYFAAAFPICGAVSVPQFLASASPLPLWIFHGALDASVTPEYDRDLYKALMTRGAKNVNYTEYPKAGHNSWDSAFAEPKLLPWLFSNKKRNGSKTW